MSPISRVLRARNSSPVLSGLVWSSIWLGAGALLLSLMLAGSTLSESRILPWVFGIHGFAAFAGGFVSARRSGRKGWYFGAVSGVLYAVLIVLLSFLATDTAWTMRIPGMLGETSLTGAVGGMLGVNTGSARRSGP